MPNPPKTDVTNPKNKYCLPCNRDFNRRQAFVEHCRNVHSMKIKFTKPISPGVPSSGGGPVKSVYNNGLRDQFSTNNYNCDYCQKGFSSRSNKNRHMLLSCDAKANAIGTKRNTSAETSTITNHSIGSLGSSFNSETHSVPSNSQSAKRKSSSHAISSRDNDFIYDPQIRPHRQGNNKYLIIPYQHIFSKYFTILQFMWAQ